MDDNEAKKMIIDMLVEIQGNMDSLHADIKEVHSEMNEMHTDLKEMRTDMHTRFDTIDNMLDRIQKNTQ